MSSPTILIVFVNAGETWLEKTDPNANLNFLPYKFTAKEMDEETGLYYYGARYLDPKYSRWISTDPALEEYIPKEVLIYAKESQDLQKLLKTTGRISFHGTSKSPLSKCVVNG